MIFYLEDWIFQFNYANESLCEHFQTNSLKGYGVDNLSSGLVASEQFLLLKGNSA